MDDKIPNNIYYVYYDTLRRCWFVADRFDLINLNEKRFYIQSTTTKPLSLDEAINLLNSYNNSEEWTTPIQCKSCDKLFIIPYSEIRWFIRKDLRIPKRCMCCRKQIEQHKTTLIPIPEFIDKMLAPDIPDTPEKYICKIDEHEEFYCDMFAGM